MIHSMTVTNYLGEKLEINLGEAYPTHGLMIWKIDGLGPAQADINTTDLTTSDGAIYNSAKLQKRNIVINLRFSEAPRIEDARQLTYKYFPIKRLCELSFLTDNRNARIQGYVEKNEPDIFSKEEGNQISIICPDPYFYSNDKGLNPSVIDFSGLDSEFEFPFSNESLTDKLLKFGEIVPIVSKGIVYNGDATTGVEMTLTAHAEIDSNVRVYQYFTPSLEPDLSNLFTLDINNFKALMGTNILSGDVITINTSLGKRRASLTRSGVEYNILNAVTRDSDWFLLSKYTNNFFIQAYGNEQYMTFQIKSYTIYEGI